MIISWLYYGITPNDDRKPFNAENALPHKRRGRLRIIYGSWGNQGLESFKSPNY